MKFQIGDLIITETENYHFILGVKDKSYVMYWINANKVTIREYKHSPIENFCTLVTSIFRDSI